jgi:hypothetical protein
MHAHTCRYAHHFPGRPEEIAALRVPLVQWAISKCPRCGATICVDPLPHICGPVWAHHEESAL